MKGVVCCGVDNIVDDIGGGVDFGMQNYRNFLCQYVVNNFVVDVGYYFYVYCDQWVVVSEKSFIDVNVDKYCQIDGIKNGQDLFWQLVRLVDQQDGQYVGDYCYYQIGGIFDLEYWVICQCYVVDGFVVYCCYYF